MDLEFGLLRILRDRREALLGGRIVPVGDRAFDVLVVLAERRHRLVTREELLSAVWGRQAVRDNNLAVQISQLRRLLGPQTIVTVPGRGYCFVPPDAGGGRAGSSGAAIAPGMDGARPVVAPADSPPLVGRGRESAKLAEAIGAERMITVVGIGGVGKTALARQVVRGAEAAWVDVEALVSRDPLPLAVARTLGVGLGGCDPMKGLVDALRPLRVLLVLDGAEHALDDVASLASHLLQHAPAVRLLVTSQMALAIGGERVFKLGPLPVPPAGCDALQAAGYASVQLLVGRSRAYWAGFVLDDANVASTIRVCELLDGLPLALELAAARLAAFGPDALLEDLGRSLRAIGHGRRDAPARQRSLLATLEASHARLPKPARRLLHRLSVFRGGFDLEMAVGIGAAGEAPGPRDLEGGDMPEPDRWAVVDALTELFDRSMVNCDTSQYPRYALLATTAALARERLRESGEEGAVRRRHARLVRGRYEALEHRLLAGAPVDDVLAGFRQDVSNALEAFDWAAGHDHECALALVPGLQHAYEGMGAAPLRDILDRAAGLLGPDIPVRLRMVWARHARRFGFSGRMGERDAILQQGIDLAREAGDRLEQYLGLLELCAVGSRDVEERLRLLGEIARLENPDWPAFIRIRRHSAAGSVLTLSGRLEEAFEHTREALQLAEQAQHSHAMFLNRNKLIDLLMMTRRRGEAIELARAAIAPLRAARRTQTLAMNQINLCGALLLEQRVEEAMPFILEGWLLGRIFHYQTPWADYLALLAALRGRAADAVRLIAHADAGYARFKELRQPNEAEAVRQAEEIAHADAAVRPADAVLREEGAAMTDEGVAATLAGLLGMVPGDVVRMLDASPGPA